MSELHDIDRRVAVLEQIAHDTLAALQDIRAELRMLRTEMHTDMQGLRTEIGTEMQGLRSEMQQLRSQQHDDFRFLLRLMIGGLVGLVALASAIGGPAIWLLLRVAAKTGALG